MSQSIAPETAAALLAAQGVAVERAGAGAAAEFISRVLVQSQGVFSKLAFEEEPSGYTATLRKCAP